MTLSYIFGNLIGRALASYGLVWLACTLASRFDWRLGFARSKRWYSLLGVLLLTVLGLGGAVAHQGGLQ